LLNKLREEKKCVKESRRPKKGRKLFFSLRKDEQPSPSGHSWPIDTKAKKKKRIKKRKRIIREEIENKRS
jgi:hypothetical protein